MAPGDSLRRVNPGSARQLPFHWRVLEAWFERAYRLTPVSQEPDTLLAYNVSRHRGAPVRLSDGRVVRRGDLVLELHFRREALLPLVREGDPARMAIGLLKLGDRDAPRLAAALEARAELREVRALHALTLFHRGISRYGFEVQPVRNPLEERWFTWWHRLLMARDHARGTERVRENLGALVTRHVWVSRESFIRRCAERTPRRPPCPGA